MMYSSTKLETEIEINEIIAVNYFEYSKNFTFSGEMHNFWEIVYADKDSLSVTVRSREEIIPPGHFYVISPMELHSVKPANKKAANAVIFSFVCRNEKLIRSAGKIIKCNNEKKEYITKLVGAAKEAFSTPLGEPYSTKLVKNKNAGPGAQNLVKIYIELFLLSLIRDNPEAPATASPLIYTSNPVLSEICLFLENNVCLNIDFKTLCDTFNMSPTNMKTLFRENIGIGAMEYFSRCKIDCAKHLIREKEMNLSQISDYLGFSSVQYFSRRFRELSNMTPSEYAASVITG